MSRWDWWIRNTLHRRWGRSSMSPLPTAPPALASTVHRTGASTAGVSRWVAPPPSSRLASSTSSPRRSATRTAWRAGAGVLALQAGQAGRDRPDPVRGGQDQAEEQVVPDPGELEQEQDRERAPGQRQEDAPEDAEIAAAVEPRRLLDLARDGGEEP